MLGLVLGGLGMRPAAAAWSQPSWSQPDTGHDYPTEIDIAVDGARHVFVGAGVEKKRFLFLSFNVFSLGLYMKPDQAREHLGTWIDVTPDRLVEDSQLYRAVNDNGIDKSMRMVVARDVTGEQIRGGFAEALVPRLKARNDPEQGLAALAQYMGYFDGRKFPNGSVMFFTCHSGGTLETRIDGEDQEPIRSPSLCWALVDTFLGTEPMNEDLKRDLVRQLPRAL